MAFDLASAVSDAYFAVTAYLEQRYCGSASGYTTSAFPRLKLGEVMRRGVSLRTSSRPKSKLDWQSRNLNLLALPWPPRPSLTAYRAAPR